MEDSGIIALYWQRDQRAISETDSKYGLFCRSLAQRILSSREDAEECVNDTWHRAWNTMPPERPRSLRAYLARIARNLSIDRWRKSRAKKRNIELEVMLSELEDCAAGGVSAEAAAENREITEGIERWLRSLPQEERRFLLGRYWYGKRVDELAAAAGCTPNRMAQRLRRLREGLRQSLEEEGISV